MDAAQREELIDQLRAMAAGRGDGLDLDSVNRWVIEDLTDPTGFFRYLGVLIPTDSILYFEGSAIVSEAAQFYQLHRAVNALSVVRDTIFPPPEIFHVTVTNKVLQGLIDLLQRHPVESCFHHVKAYREEKLLFTFHDAFDGSDLLLSDRVPEESISEFSFKFGVKYRCEPNLNKRDSEQLRRLLWALENPQELRINWPRWKKAVFFWKK